MNRCWFFHQWSKWNQITIEKLLIPTIDNVKKSKKIQFNMLTRTCSRCGDVQRKNIKY